MRFCPAILFCFTKYPQILLYTIVVRSIYIILFLFSSRSLDYYFMCLPAWINIGKTLKIDRLQLLLCCLFYILIFKRLQAWGGGLNRESMLKVSLYSKKNPIIGSFVVCIFFLFWYSCILYKSVCECVVFKRFWMAIILCSIFWFSNFRSRWNRFYDQCVFLLNCTLIIT